MTGLTVKPVDGGTEPYGKPVSELQSDVTIHGDEIHGTLHYVKEYSEFSSSPDQQEGNFLALSLAGDKGTTVKTEVIGGTAGERTVDDGFCVYRLTNPAEQKIKVTVEKGEAKESVTYDLTNLILEEDADD